MFLRLGSNAALRSSFTAYKGVSHIYNLSRAGDKMNKSQLHRYVFEKNCKTIVELCNRVSCGKRVDIWKVLSRNKAVTMADVRAHPDESWDWAALSYNKTMEYVRAHPDLPWDWWLLSSNPNITMEVVLALPDKPWHWSALSRNPIITMEDDVLAHPDESWDWVALSSDRNITMEVVLALPDKPWHWSSLSFNPNITMADVLSHPDQPWHWFSLSYNPNITMEDVLAHPDKPWNWSSLSYNPNITMADVLAHPDKPWHWGRVCSKKSITIADVMALTDHCSSSIYYLWTEICANPEIFEPTMDDMVEFVRRTVAARLICRTVFRAFTDPRYAYCRNRLLREFDRLKKRPRRSLLESCIDVFLE